MAMTVNRWKIPTWLEEEVLQRDRKCIYCGITFGILSATRRDRPSWEHIINDARIVTRENIALCCIGCNASKGRKSLSEWIAPKYCQSRGITECSIAPVARRALERLKVVVQNDV
jgi:hypothetical protein